MRDRMTNTSEHLPVGRSVGRSVDPSIGVSFDCFGDHKQKNRALREIRLEQSRAEVSSLSIDRRPFSLSVPVISPSLPPPQALTR